MGNGKKSDVETTATQSQLKKNTTSTEIIAFSQNSDVKRTQFSFETVKNKSNKGISSLGWGRYFYKMKLSINACLKSGLHYSLYHIIFVMRQPRLMTFSFCGTF